MDIIRMDRVEEEQIAFYRRFEWQLFATFTFARRLRNGDEEARWRWKGFMNELEREHGDTIGRLVVEEARHSSGALSGIRLHYHALLASDRPLSTALVRRLWAQYAGNGRRLADIRQYDPRGNAVAYCLKLHGSMAGDLDLHNLDLYSPIRLAAWDRNSRSRRRWRRQLARRGSGCVSDRMPR